MYRALKFISVFLGVAILMFLFIFGINRSSFELMFENRDGLAEGSEWVEETYSMEGLTNYIAEHPNMISIASIVVDNPDSSIYYGEEIPRTMGTLSNLFIFIAYANAFEQGEIDPDEGISWDEITLYMIPEIGEAVHHDAYSAGRNRGWINDSNILSVKHAIYLLSKYNSLALSDYLLDHVGADRIAELYTHMSLQDTDHILPFSGLITTLSPSIQGVPFGALVHQWQTNSPNEFEKNVYANSNEFSKGELREEWLAIFRNNRRGINFMQQRDLLAFFPQTTASELSRVMFDLLQGDVISENVSSRVIEWLNFPEEEATIERNFDRYGALYDNRMGLLNGVDFGTSAYTGDTTVQAVFFDRIHIAVWFHMSSNHMHQDFQQRMIWDPALIESLKEAIDSPDITDIEEI